MAWYEKHGPLRKRTDAPRVGVLLYRKHVITQQPYIAQLIEMMEADGVLPIPIFINGIEAHTVVSPFIPCINRSGGHSQAYSLCR